MKTILGHVIQIVTFALTFVLVTFLISTATGDGSENYDIKEELITGLIAGIVFQIIKSYSRKRNK